MSGKLSIIATPIGNLGDISERAKQTLLEADTICAEDTRVTGRLLKAYKIHSKLERCDENIISAKAQGLISRMLNGEHIAFCSDAGMPGVSDPGMVLIDAAHNAKIEVEVLPGASAVTTALVAAGFGGTAFYFGGFLPKKTNQRIKLLETLKELDASLVFYESPHRVVQAAKDIASVFETRRVALCRELTKLHEEVLRLPATELAKNLEARESIKGEIVLVIDALNPDASKNKSDLNFDAEQVQDFIKEKLSGGAAKPQLAKALAKEFGFSKTYAYNYLLNCKITD